MAGLLDQFLDDTDPNKKPKAKGAVGVLDQFLADTDPAPDQPDFMAGPGDEIPGIPQANPAPPVDIRVGAPKYPTPANMHPVGNPGATGSWGPSQSGTWDIPDQPQGPIFKPIDNPRQEAAPPATGFWGNAARAVFPSTLGAPSVETPEMVPDEMGGYKPTSFMEQPSNPLETVGDLGGAAVRAAGSTLDPILPWNARGKTPDGKPESWLQGMQDPSTGLARPAREKLAEQIGKAWENATDEDKPYIERVGSAMLAELGGAATLGAATVEDPFFMAPLAAGTKVGRGVSDAVGRGLESVGRDQMYRVVKPGIPVERKGFNVQDIFDENVGGAPHQIFDKSKSQIKSLSDELSRRIQEGADEGHRIDMASEIDKAVADIKANPGASSDNVAMVDDFDRVVARMKARARKIAPGGRLDLAQAQHFKQDLGHRGAWRHISEKRGIPLASREKSESMLSEKVYHHLNETIDDLAPSGVRDVNRRLSKLIPVNQAAGHRMVIEGRNNKIRLNDMLSALAISGNPKMWPLLALNRVTTSGKAANAIYKLGSRLRTATTSAEKARYIAALKKLGLSDEEIMAGVRMVDESGGEEAFKKQDIRIKEGDGAGSVEQPPNAIPFRRQGEPPAPPKRRTLPQEGDASDGENPILYQEGSNLPAIRSENLPAEVEPEAQPTFYSQLRRAAPEILKKAGGKMKPQDFLNSLLKGGTKVKPDEVKWSGLLEYLKERAAGMAPGGDVTDMKLTREMDKVFERTDGVLERTDGIQEWPGAHAAEDNVIYVLNDLNNPHNGNVSKPGMFFVKPRGSDFARAYETIEEAEAAGGIKPNAIGLKGGRRMLSQPELKKAEAEVDRLNEEMSMIVNRSGRDNAGQLHPTERAEYDALMEQKLGIVDEILHGIAPLEDSPKRVTASKDNTPVTAQEIEDYLNENEVQLVEHRHGFMDPDERGNIKEQVDKLERQIEILEEKKNGISAGPERVSIMKRQRNLQDKWDELRARLSDESTRHEQYNIHKDLGTGSRPSEYGEILLSWKRKPKTQRTLGIKDNAAYEHSHWHENDVVVHVRHHTAHTPDGKRVLFIDEIQGDWGQQGRKQGFRGQRAEDEAQLQKLKADLEKTPDTEANGESRLALKKQIERLDERVKGSSYGAPEGPFVDTTQKWTLLGMKRMIRYAAENGFDHIAWSTGEQQAKRWNFSQVVDKIAYQKEGDKYFVTPFQHGREIRAQGLDLSKAVSRAELADIIGEDMTKRIDSKVAEGQQSGNLDAHDFALGGEGHKAFYNKMVPSAVGKYTEKNWGVKPEEMTVAFKKSEAPAKKYNPRATETPDGRFRIQEHEQDPQEMGNDPIEYRLVDRRGNVLDTERSEDRLLDSEEWPKTDSEDHDVEMREPDEVRYDIEEHSDGRWYIVDNDEPRNELTPANQKDLFDHRDTRNEGHRYDGPSPYDDISAEEIHRGFDDKEEAEKTLADVREHHNVDQPQWYITEGSGRYKSDYAGPFDSEDEARSEDNFPQQNDYDAASIEPFYGDPYTEYTVVDEDGHQVVDDYFQDEGDAIDAMHEHASENPADDAETPAGHDPAAATVETKQQGIKITDAMRKSAMEGQELFQKQKGAVKGHIQKKRLNSVITFFKGRADATTWMHEHGHWLRSDVLTPEQNAAVLKWTGEKAWTRHAEEKFARGLERYLYNGVAPHKNLQAPFATMQQAFKEAYKQARGTEIGQDIPEAMKLVYDAIFLRGQKIRDVAKVQRLLQAARRAGMSSPRILTLLKQELNDPKKKEPAYAR